MKSKFHDVLKIKNKNFPENFVYQISKIIGASFSNLLDLLILNLSLPSIASSYIYLSILEKVPRSKLSFDFSHIYQQTLKRSA